MKRIKKTPHYLAEPGEKTIADIIGVGDLVIDKYEENDEELVLVTANGKEIIIDKFVPYCVCNIGEYIDKITPDGKISGVITDVIDDTEDTGEYDENTLDLDEIVYRGTVSILFEHGSLTLDVHGEDNGFYGVVLRMPVRIKNRKLKRKERRKNEQIYSVRQAL